MSLFLRNILRPYLVTVLLEMTVAAVWGIRRKKDFFVVFLVNTITNPLINLLLILMGMYLPYSAYRGVIAILEIVIWLLEGFMFKNCIEKIRRPYAFSFCLNGVSFFLGGFLLIML